MATESLRLGNPLRFKTEDVATGTLFLLICFVLLGPISSSPLTTQGEAELTGEGSVLRQIFYAAAFGMALICSMGLKPSGQLRLIPISILLVLAWSAASLAWSINPGIAIRRLGLTAIIIFSIFLLVEKTGYERTVSALRISLVLLLLANYVAVLGWPVPSIHQATEADPSIVGAWHGILPQKNFAGTVCAFAVLFFVFDAKAISRLLRVAVIVAASYFLYRSESKTSMILLLLSLGLGVISSRYNPYNRLLLLLSMAAVLSAGAIGGYQYWDVIAAPFDNEDTLTGRVQIWPLLLEYWRDHWLTGSGFGSFWNIGGTEPISAYTEGWIAEITSGHNGYLDLLVQIGLPGLVLVIVATILAPVWKFMSSKRLDPARRSLLLAIFFFAVWHNLTESSLFDRDATVHVFLILTIALMGTPSRAESEDSSSIDE